MCESNCKQTLNANFKGNFINLNMSVSNGEFKCLLKLWDSIFFFKKNEFLKNIEIGLKGALRLVSLFHVLICPLGKKELRF